MDEPASVAARRVHRGMRTRGFVFAAFMTLVGHGHAADAARTEFLGLDATDTLVRISYEDEPAPWTGGNPIYGAIEREELRYCWIETAPPKPGAAKAPLSAEVIAFNCTRVRGAKPSVQYLPVEGDGARPEDPADPMRVYHRVATKAGLADDALLRAYVCKTGCGPATPRFMFAVNAVK